MQRIAIILFLVIASTTLAQSQTATFTISAIDVVGNTKTKSNIILRELDFQVGDQLVQGTISERLERNRQYLFGTKLFTEVNISLVDFNSSNTEVTVRVDVRENLFLYPLANFDLLDRSWLIWWNDFRWDFSRVAPYILLTHLNLTGRQDELKLRIQWFDFLGTGDFTRRLEGRYNFPYLDKQQTLRLEVGLFYQNSNTVRIQTLQNRDSFLMTPSRIQQRLRTRLRLQYRPVLYTRHLLNLEFEGLQVDELIAASNPNYFLNADQRHRFFRLGYTFQLDRRDNAIYPIQGVLFGMSITKEGLGIFQERNTLIVRADLRHHQRWSERWSSQVSFFGESNLIRQQVPFYDYRSVGTNVIYIRGYEQYAIDGQDFWYGKLDLRYRLLDTEINFGKYMPFRQFQRLPIQVYAKVYDDFGAVNDPYYAETNALNNIWLNGFGFGLDIVAYRSSFFQIEYSFNHLGEHNFFYHWELAF